jgi:uncharacterized Zn-binding protein involved in type VI secretion
MRRKPTEGDTIVGPPAAKQGDKVVGTDIHIIMVPSPGGPVPTPTPLPFNGMLTTGLSTDVFIEGKPAATVQSGATNMPPHIPPGGPFQKPPSNQGKIIVGSTGVFINKKPAARQGDTAMTCNDPVDAPTGTVMAVGTVFIGETGAGAPVTPPPPQPTEQKLVKADFGQPGKIIEARWEKDKVKCGDTVKMIVDVKDFEDGTPARFIIWEEDVDGENDFIVQIEGKVKGNKVEADWVYSPEKVEKDLKEEVEYEEGQPEYFFAVNIEEEEARSGILTFTYPLDIYLEDEEQNPLDDVEYKVTFSDGTEKTGKFQKGHAKIEDAPYGTFILEVDGYDLAIKQRR